MKKTNSIKEVLLQAIFITTILLFTSSSNNYNKWPSRIIAEKLNDAKIDEDNRKIDSAFLVRASEINLKEIQLGQLAQQKGKRYHIRQLGELIKNSHSQSQRDLTSLAKSKMMTIPTSSTDDANDAYNSLIEKTGHDFDKAYANSAVQEHKDAIDAFEEAAEECTDQEIRNWAKLTLPELRKHLDYSIESQTKCEKINH